jgi:hypothetical protein
VDKGIMRRRGSNAFWRVYRDAVRIGKIKGILTPASVGVHPPTPLASPPTATPRLGCARARWRGTVAPVGAHQRKDWGGAALLPLALDTRRKMGVW